MPKYRKALPQLSGDVFLTDGGLETTLIFHDGLELPEFAAFVLLESTTGREALLRYFRHYAALARERRVGFVLESPTWRASSAWGAKLGYAPDALARLNREAIELLSRVRDEYETERSPMVISGCMGPRGDGYRADEKMSIQEAQDYHADQIETFTDTEADMVSAFTVPYVEEGIGFVRAATAAQIPTVVSFTVETDGCLPSGQTLGDAIEQLDDATGGATAYFMINCAHPTHFADALPVDAPWLQRLRGVRANASRMSHAELDEAEELDDGNPVQLGGESRDLRARLTHLNILGGCCGTDHRHIEAICDQCL
ncbi:MAG: homocysteine S-methyltransferase family protein [Pseudomonadota bacterium]|nr:MAG: homocysteine S-methyltransferase family protein [Pseudomonadota bacterium]